MYPVKKVKPVLNIPEDKRKLNRVVRRVAEHHLKNHAEDMEVEEKKKCIECIEKCKK